MIYLKLDNEAEYQDSTLKSAEPLNLYLGQEFTKAFLSLVTVTINH